MTDKRTIHHVSGRDDMSFTETFGDETITTLLALGLIRVETVKDYGDVVVKYYIPVPPYRTTAEMQRGYPRTV